MKWQVLQVENVSWQYHVLQLFGYRRVYYRAPEYFKIPLTSYWGWVWKPRWKAGTYADDDVFELSSGLRFIIYGSDLETKMMLVLEQ